MTRTFHFIALTLSNLTLIASGRAAARCWMRVGAFCGTVIRNCVSVQNEKENDKKKRKRERESKISLCQFLQLSYSWLGSFFGVGIREEHAYGTYTHTHTLTLDNWCIWTQHAACNIETSHRTKGNFGAQSQLSWDIDFHFECMQFNQQLRKGFLS